MTDEMLVSLNQRPRDAHSSILINDEENIPSYAVLPYAFLIH